MPIDFKQLQIPRLTRNDVCIRADEFREQHWGRKTPIDVGLIAERNLGILIIPVPDLRYYAHTEAYLSGDLREIVYDPTSSDVRTRFSVAHELGHYVLHRNVIRQLRPKSYEEWKEIQRDIPEILWSRAEWQAYEFAGRLLVPPSILIEELKKLKPPVDKAREQLGVCPSNIFKSV